jgi:CheY-like chemotaxis protein
MNILLVDDEAMMRKMVKLTLQKRGFQVFDAAAGSQAIALAEQHPIDILVTDIVMDDMDGWTLAGSLTQRHPGLPVVFTSGYPVDFEDERPKDVHCTFLSKPFQPVDLVNAISDLTCVSV